MPALRGPDGKVIFVGDEEVQRYTAGGEYTRVDSATAGATQSQIAKPEVGVRGQVRGALSSFLSGMTLGGSDLLLTGSDEEAEQLAAERAANPTLSGVSQAAGMILPALVTGGAATPTGYLSSLAAKAGAEGGARAIASTAAEGAIQNAGIYLSDVALGDRELSAEGVTGALGTGLAFGAAGHVAAQGIEAGTIAARRMFARYAEGGEKAAQQAAQQWSETSAKTLEGYDQAAELARARLSEAASAREQAALAQQQASAGLAEARAGIGRPVEVPPEPAGPPNERIALLLRERAMAAANPESLAAFDVKFGQEIESLRGATATPESTPAAVPAPQPRAVADLTGVPVRPDLQGALDRLVAAGAKRITPAAESELTDALAEYTGARRAFDEMRARVDPDLEAALTGLGEPIRGTPTGLVGHGEFDLQAPPVAFGEFGPPGRGALKSQDDLARLAAGTGAPEAGAVADETRALRGGAKGTPVGPVGDAAAAAPVESGPAAGQLGNGSQAAKEIGSEAEFRTMQDDLRAKLTPEEIKHSLRYSREDYNDVNRFLRGDERVPKLGDAEAGIIPHLDSVIDKAATAEPLVVYRSVHFDPGQPEFSLKPGDALSDPAYMSMSYRAGNIERFGNTKFVIEAPAGAKIAAIPSAAPEGELLAARGSRLRITSREESAGANQWGHKEVTYHATLEPPAPKDAAIARPPATDTLTGQLRGTAAGLSEGKSLGQIAAESPARAEYVAAKQAKTAEAAEHFRGKALADKTTAFDIADTNLRFSPKKRSYFDDTGESLTPPPVSEMKLGLSPRAEPMESGTVAREHPLAIKQLEMAHDVALDRVAAATTATEKAEAQAEVKAIEKQITKVGARPGAIEDVAAMAHVTTQVEKAAAKLTEALGVDAPPAAREAAKAFRSAEDAASRKTVARIARSADDWTKEQAAMPAEPTGKQRLGAAKQAKLEADAKLATARAAESEARLGARAAGNQADELRAQRPGDAAAPSTEKGTGKRLLEGAKAIGTAAELAGDFGIPGVPKPHDIPVIGPILSAYLKYRAFRAAAGRFVGRVPATAETRAAALAARTKDSIARAVDQSLGLVSRSTPVVRRALVASSLVVNDALARRAIDDGQPDAPKGASTSELAAVRMREVAAAATNPQLVVDRVRKETRHMLDPDLIDALESHLLAMYKHLNDTAPKGPPPNPYTQQQWSPSAADALQWGRRLAVANNPVVAFEALHAQALTLEAADTLRAVYPKLFAMAQQRLIERASELKHPVEYRQLAQNSLLFDLPLHSSFEPENAAVLQSAHAPIAPAPPPGGPAGVAPPVPSIANPTNLSQVYQTTADRRATR